MKFAKCGMDVERDRGKKAKIDIVAHKFKKENFNPHIDQGRLYIRFVATELLKHPSLKSDLVIGMACFDYNVLFVLPKTQAVDCYCHSFESLISCGWFARELRNVPGMFMCIFGTISDTII